MECGEVVAGSFVEACGDAAELLELVEEALDEVALAVEIGRDGALDLAVALGGDVGLSAAGCDQVQDGLGVVAAVGDQGSVWGEARQEVGDGGLVRGLAGGDREGDRQARAVDNGVDLGAQSSTRTADGVIRAPFLPPAACWWARMMELSISCSACGERAASAAKTRSQTPALAQRL
jgi:hypothetical protein